MSNLAEIRTRFKPFLIRTGKLKIGLHMPNDDLMNIFFYLFVQLFEFELIWIIVVLCDVQTFISLLYIVVE
jgi:hypothetical protein